MFFTLLFLQYTVGVSSTEALVDEATTFISHVLPPMLCYFVMAVLAITPQTRTIRLALFPVMLLLALRAAVPMDVSLKGTERKFHHNLACWMFLTTTRALGWALARKSLVRQLRPANSTPSTLMDALDLVSNFRGYGWDWSRGVHIPRETRPSNRTGFIFSKILSLAAHAFAFGILNTAIGSFSSAGLGKLSCGHVLEETLPFLHRATRICFPVRFGDISGGYLFDASLPFYSRFLRSSVISALALVWAYVALQSCYDSCTILGVVILGQDPAQWPPAFDAPWCATSLADFWGRRWHQWLRHILLILGAHPLSFIFGRAGVLIGAFLAAAVIHHFGLITVNRKSEFWRMLVGFGMMAVGIIIENTFKHVTRRKVQGLAGWVWTMGWILLWGHAIIDGYARAGMFSFPTLIDLVPPLRMSVEDMVTEFDTLLHAISSAPVA
ncbi:hypothetical protein OG21DRAFT_1485819 [Imleria badia]|nr:hypothetical protein OG21DRAFT_1485819 [Imleria badia]